jgi:hypothetical protein
MKLILWRLRSGDEKKSVTVREFFLDVRGTSKIEWILV